MKILEVMVSTVCGVERHKRGVWVMAILRSAVCVMGDGYLEICCMCYLIIKIYIWFLFNLDLDVHVSQKLSWDVPWGRPHIISTSGLKVSGFALSWV